MLAPIPTLSVNPIVLFCDGSIKCSLICIFHAISFMLTQDLRYDEDQGFNTAANLTPINYVVFQNGW